jgi:hypothetical protein
MAVILTLTSPITHPSTTVWTIERMTTDFRARALSFQWYGNNGEAGSAVYPTPAILNPNGGLQATGDALINTLVTFNFSVGANMEVMIFQFLQADGYLGAGVISGQP